MIAFPASVRVWIAVGRTDMRRGMNGLALQVRQALGRDPHAGDLYVFRGARGDLADTDRRRRRDLSCTACLLDGIDWRNPRHTFRPAAAG